MQIYKSIENGLKSAIGVIVNLHSDAFQPVSQLSRKRVGNE